LGLELWVHATRIRKPVDTGQLFVKCQHLQYGQAKINVLLCGTLFLLLEGFQNLPKVENVISKDAQLQGIGRNCHSHK
jgi:hypothetical protein